MTELLTPPVPPDCDLQRYRRMPVDIVKLRQSGLQMECSPEEKWFAFELWMAAFHQVPAGSLPDEDAKLAYMAGLARDKRTWNRVKKAALRGFVKHSDGRLYHPVLSNICLEVWETMRARKRGAKLTNAKRSEGQPVDKSQSQSGSAPRSTYNERNDQRADSGQSAPRSAVATEGKDTPSPIPPSSRSAGSACAGAPAARPANQTAEPDRVLVILPSGAKLEIDRFGNADEVWAPLDCPDTKLTPAQYRELRAKALAARAPPANPEAA